MSAPEGAGPETATARIERLGRLRQAHDGQDRATRLADAVASRLEHLWRTGGRDGATGEGHRPDRIMIRAPFVYRRANDSHDPVVPRLLRTQGLQLRLQLLLLFDAQCRYSPRTPVRNARNIVRRADDQYPGWRELVLSDVQSSERWGPRGRPPRSVGELRRRQITDALVGLEKLRLVHIPRHEKSGRFRYNGFHLLSEAGSSERPPYTVPVKGGLSLPREFFTSLWVWVLSDAEIATYLMLQTMRDKRPGKHAGSGVFVTSGYRESMFNLQRATWRSADMLYRFRLIDKMPSAGRSFRAGKIGDPRKTIRGAPKPVVRYKIKDEALAANALSTVWQVLTAPTDRDRVRRDRGPFAEEADAATRSIMEI